MPHGRRWTIRRIGTDEKPLFWWCVWRLWERMSGITESYEAAETAVEHFHGW